MTNRVYPDRVRCRACRSYFGFLYVDGMFCSYECAGLPEPSRNPEDWPRQHHIGFRPRFNGVPQEKRWFRSEGEALDSPGAKGQDAYRCEYCRHWHLGHKRADQEEER